MSNHNPIGTLLYAFINTRIISKNNVGKHAGRSSKDLSRIQIAVDISFQYLILVTFWMRINIIGLLLQKKEANLMTAMVATEKFTLKVLKELILMDLKI
jgi:hypothetical protein